MEDEKCYNSLNINRVIHLFEGRKTCAKICTGSRATKTRTTHARHVGRSSTCSSTRSSTRRRAAFTGLEARDSRFKRKLSQISQPGRRLKGQQPHQDPKDSLNDPVQRGQNLKVKALILGASPIVTMVVNPRLELAKKVHILLSSQQEAGHKPT